MTTTVVIVDDHAVVRDGLRALVNGADDLELVGEAGSVSEARTLLVAHQPDIALLDVVLPDGDGIQLCREVGSLSPDTRCLLLTSFPEPRAKLSAAISGAAGYLSKDVDSETILQAVRRAAAGEQLLQQQGELQEALEQLTRLDDGDDPRLGELTPQEQRVFELLGLGMSNREIGDELHLNEHTVKNYVSHLLSKLDMSRRTEAAVLAARLSERRAGRDARGLESE